MYSTVAVVKEEEEKNISDHNCMNMHRSSPQITQGTFTPIAWRKEWMADRQGLGVWRFTACASMPLNFIPGECIT